MKKNSTIINEIDRARLKLSIEHYIKYFIGKRTCELTKDEALQAISLAVREFAMDKMYETIARYNKCNSKRVYYLSIEYLIGRSLENNLHNLGLFEIMKNVKIDGFPTFLWKKFLIPNMIRRWVTAVSDVWPPAIWTLWLRWAWPVLAMESIISSVCLSKSLKTAIKLSRQTAGRQKTLHGSLPATIEL